MKGFGSFVLVIGVIWLLVAINMDTTVVTTMGSRVNNIGLLADKQNHIMIGAFIILCGLLCVVLGRRNSVRSDVVKCPFCAELIKPEARKCKDCGSDLTQKLELNPYPEAPHVAKLLFLLTRFKHSDFLDENLVLIDSKISEFCELAAVYCDAFASKAKSRQDAKNQVVEIIKEISTAYDEKNAQDFQSKCSDFFSIAARKLRGNARET
ncbi:zinc ribbon domain-containing protein [Pectobacterium versatile]|uniref:zinc ribbon domain-containing protein n=1 Tax=Pectobacterium versatile TaxID=2488639 RepID=UPI001CF16B80|nr:zinc ribbon domain-containing protein [Pectobacterium versatile]MCA6927774.1 zinc ribbon domain-containing protein [Pectobacterium versatile]MCH5084520.1 zinc ribbon domain-containing protein [Pectobacterium versatile]